MYVRDRQTSHTSLVIQSVVKLQQELSSCNSMIDATGNHERADSALGLVEGFMHLPDLLSDEHALTKNASEFGRAVGSAMK
jgi:hypothetical protein